MGDKKGGGLHRAPDKKKELTAREKQVLKQLAEGKTYADIAVTLLISIETVRRHAANIYNKLDVKNRMQAVLKYYGSKS